MREELRPVTFSSPIGPHIEAMIAEKRALGFKWVSPVVTLLWFDRFLVQSGLSEPRVPKELVLKWTEKRPNEARRTHVERMYTIRLLCVYLAMHGVEAYVPSTENFPRLVRTFRPRILTRAEIGMVMKAAESLPHSAKSPLFHIAMPLIFRLLYGCGLRLSEALKLRLQDVDLQQGILLIHQAKFMRERLVPLAPGLWKRVDQYVRQNRHQAQPSDFLFPSCQGGRYCAPYIYTVWRELLYKAGIPWEGKGKGPRIHDVRHTFAVHRLAAWHEAGEDLSVLLPVLSTYLGHTQMRGTQHYLRMAAELYPEVSSRLERDHGHAIPTEEQP